jgi:hypothetical protein
VDIRYLTPQLCLIYFEPDYQELLEREMKTKKGTQQQSYMIVDRSTGKVMRDILNKVIVLPPSNSLRLFLDSLFWEKASHLQISKDLIGVIERYIY